MEFQSALRAEAGSDAAQLDANTRLTLFQSALRAEAGSDASSAYVRGCYFKFQSALRAEAGSDAFVFASSNAWTCFNPRSAPKRGATREHLLRCGSSDVSIRAPRRSGERLRLSQMEETQEIT